METRSLSAEEIVTAYSQRMSAMENRRGVMARIGAIYNNEIEVPLPELDKSEKPAVANVIEIGIDQYAGRIASSVPILVTPPMNPGQAISEKRARIRRQALMAWQEKSMLGLQLYKRARELLGFSFSVTEIRWDAREKCPKWHWRNPMHCFPPPMGGLALMQPHDMIYAYQMPVGQVISMFGMDAAPMLASMNRDTWVEVIEYVSAVERVFIVREAPMREMRSDGEEEDIPQPFYPKQEDSAPRYAEVSRAPNPLDVCPVTIVERIGLVGSHGKFDSLEGMFMLRAQLFALEQLAIKRSIFADVWIESRENERGSIAVEADGMGGTIGEVSGATIKVVEGRAGYQTGALIDATERNERLAGGVSPEFSGESPTNVRTGRRGSAVLSEVVSYTVMESHKIIAAAMAVESETALRMDKRYSGRGEKKIWSLASGQMSYSPSKDFDMTTVGIRFPLPGADSSEAVVAAGQRVGMGTMSKRTMMSLDPMVPDDEIEANRVTSERLEEALLAGVAQQAQAGSIPPSDIAEIQRLVEGGDKTLAEALLKVQEDAQKRQATEAPPGSPETQPGLALPGVGAEQPVAGGGGPPGAAGAPAPLGGGAPLGEVPTQATGPPALADLLGAL